MGDDPEITIGEFASAWLTARELKPRTVKPAFGDRHLDGDGVDQVRSRK